MVRRLSDLFVVGKEVTFGDGKGDPITVWLQKLNDVEHDKAARKAQSARAKVIASRKQENSDTYLSSIADAAEYEREEMVVFLALDEVENFGQATEAEIAEEGKWNEDGYLQGLRDAWLGSDGEKSLAVAYAEDPEEEEAKHVHDELVRYQSQVQSKNQELLADARARFEECDDAKLEELIAFKLLKMAADKAWIKEFQRSQVWLSVRDPKDHKKQYWETRDEVDVLQQPLIEQILDHYSNLEVDPIEGKDLEEAPPSSASSEAPKATSKPSGQKAQTISKKSQRTSTEQSVTQSS